MVVGGQSISAVSTVSTVSSEQWAASPTLETECSANFYISEYFTNYLFNIRDTHSSGAWWTAGDPTTAGVAAICV